MTFISKSAFYRTITESAVDRLLMELTNEKQERAALERVTQSQAEEFLARLDRLQRYIILQPVQSLVRSSDVGQLYAFPLVVALKRVWGLDESSASRDPSVFTFYLTTCFPTSITTFTPFFCRENDDLLSRLSQSILRSEEVPVALEAMQVQHMTSHHITSLRNRYP